MYRIEFTQKTSAYFENDTIVCLATIKCWEYYINDLFKVRGYMYMNYIYETFGVEWNPRWENLCFIYDGRPIVFNTQNNDDGFVIDIERNREP